MDTPRDRWRPLLDGELAERAAAAAREIGESLTAPETPWEGSAGSLATGACGAALLFAYLDRSGLRPGASALAGPLLDGAIEAVAASPIDASLYGGFAGVGWAVAHLVGDADDDDDPIAAVDEALLELLAPSPWPGQWDLVSGLAGMAVYALERLPRPAPRRCLELLLDRLEELAETGDGRATWQTSPALLLDGTRERFPAGLYDVGVAHGVPGLVAVLAAIEAAGIGGGRAGRLAGGARSWVLDQAAPEGGFPYFTGPGIETRQARLAWCYGDIGVAAALAAAGRAAGDARVIDQALAVARRAAEVPVSGGGVVDAGLCHGAAGVAHLFNRLHQESGDEACADAARRWFARALELRQPGSELAGFLSWGKGGGGEAGWQVDPGFLTGATGIALALAGAVSSVEPAWDRILLTSCRVA